MTEKCFDIGIIQAFLDGELDSEKSESVARHVAVCDVCAIELAMAEEESALAFSALEQEFNTLVPTQRLWTKINDSIEKEQKSFWRPIFAFLLQPSTAAFAGLIFVALVSVTLFSLKPHETNNYVAEQKPTIQNPISIASANPPSEIKPNDAQMIVTPTAPIAPRNVQTATYTPNRNETRAVKVNFVKATTEDVRPKNNIPEVVTPAPSEQIRGEESYLKTIATLTETVNERKDQTLGASSRFAFERDLAVTEDAIKQMRKEVQRNPKDEAARQMLRASYQNKIDLLNSVAEKTELMASLK